MQGKESTKRFTWMFLNGWTSCCSARHRSTGIATLSLGNIAGSGTLRGSLPVDDRVALTATFDFDTRSRRSDSCRHRPAGWDPHSGSGS